MSFFLREPHLTGSYSVPPQLFAVLLPKWLQCGLDQHIQCLCSHVCRTVSCGPAHSVSVQSPFQNCVLVQSPLQRVAQLSRVSCSSQIHITPAPLPSGGTDAPPAQLSSFWFCPLVCCPKHASKYWAVLEAELQGHDPPSWKSKALIITLDYGTSTCVASAWWLCFLLWDLVI